MATRRAILCISLAMLVAGCGLRPLYGTSGAAGGVKSELSSVAIPEPQTRLGQLIRNDLLSAMRPAGQRGPDKYSLLLVPVLTEEQAIVNDSTDTLRKTVRVNVSYTLKQYGSDKSLSAGKTFSQVAYDETGQSFADNQARTNAIERAAKEAAQDIGTRVAAYFASAGG